MIGYCADFRLHAESRGLRNLFCFSGDISCLDNMFCDTVKLHMLRPIFRTPYFRESLFWGYQAVHMSSTNN